MAGLNNLIVTNIEDKQGRPVRKTLLKMDYLDIVLKSVDMNSLEDNTTQPTILELAIHEIRTGQNHYNIKKLKPIIWNGVNTDVRSIFVDLTDIKNNRLVFDMVVCPIKFGFGRNPYWGPTCLVVIHLNNFTPVEIHLISLIQNDDNRFSDLKKLFNRIVLGLQQSNRRNINSSIVNCNAITSFEQSQIYNPSNKSLKLRDLYPYYLLSLKNGEKNSTYNEIDASFVPANRINVHLKLYSQELYDIFYKTFYNKNDYRENKYLIQRMGQIYRHYQKYYDENALTAYNKTQPVDNYEMYLRRMHEDEESTYNLV